MQDNDLETCFLTIFELFFLYQTQEENPNFDVFVYFSDKFLIKF